MLWLAWLQGNQKWADRCIILGHMREFRDLRLQSHKNDFHKSSFPFFYLPSSPYIGLVYQVCTFSTKSLVESLPVQDYHKTNGTLCLWLPRTHIPPRSISITISKCTLTPLILVVVKWGRPRIVTRILINEQSPPPRAFRQETSTSGWGSWTGEHQYRPTGNWLLPSSTSTADDDDDSPRV